MIKLLMFHSSNLKQTLGVDTAENKQKVSKKAFNFLATELQRKQQLKA